MKGTMYILRTDGTHERSDLDSTPGLKALQAGVKGSIEIVPYFTMFIPPMEDGNLAELQNVCQCVAFCNEEGRLKRLPPNNQANHYWEMATGRKISPGHHLVGDIVILTGDAEFMESL